MQGRSECAPRLPEGHLDSSLLRAHMLCRDLWHLWDEILAWFDWAVWEPPQNFPWERRAQPWCQLPSYLWQAHASAAGAGTQRLQAGSATSRGTAQPQPGPAALGHLHPCGHPPAQQVTRNSLPAREEMELLPHGAGTPRSCCSLCALTEILVSAFGKENQRSGHFSCG